MIMNGVFQIGCDIAEHLCKISNEIYKDQENLNDKIVLLRLDLNVLLKWSNY